MTGAAIGPYRALRHGFEVRCDDEQLGHHLAEVFAPLADATVSAPTTYELEVHGRVRGSRLVEDGTTVVDDDDPTRAVAHLLHRVNVNGIERSDGWTLLHAGAVTVDGAAVLLPAPMEAGKSTLVTALVDRGCGYITDETVAIDPVDGAIHTYPRAISLDPGSWHLFPALAPTVPPAVQRYLPEQWQVHPAPAVPPLARVPDVAAVISHRYVPGNTTSLVELDAVEALRRLLECCFTFPGHPQRDLDVLASVLERVATFDLSVGDLDAATDLVASATFVPPDPRPASRHGDGTEQTGVGPHSRA